MSLIDNAPRAPLATTSADAGGANAYTGLGVGCRTPSPLQPPVRSPDRGSARRVCDGVVTAGGARCLGARARRGRPRELADDITEGLRDRGIGADVAYDGSVAIEKAVMTRYDVVVLDRDLPRVHGDAVCAALTAASSEARILMLTASATIGDRVEGLNLGADDYLTKPFAFDELVARVHALARRAPAAPVIAVRGDLVFDRARRRVSRAGRPVSLTRKELGVLEELLVADGAVVSAEELLERVWDENADPFTRTVTVTIARLRSKLGDPDPIETMIGSGYRLR